MMEIVIGVLVGVVFFVSTVGAYTIGVKHGRIVKDGGNPEVNPVKVIKENKEVKQQKEYDDKITEGIHNILNYGNPIKEAGD